MFLYIYRYINTDILMLIYIHTYFNIYMHLCVYIKIALKISRWLPYTVTTNLLLIFSVFLSFNQQFYLCNGVVVHVPFNHSLHFQLVAHKLCDCNHHNVWENNVASKSSPGFGWDISIIDTTNSASKISSKIWLCHLMPETHPSLVQHSS